MSFKLKRNIALTDSTWELQRQVYIQKEQSLNPEFSRFKAFSGMSQGTKANVNFNLSPVSMGDEIVVRLPVGYRSLRVYSGCAWVTYRGCDHVLKPGDEMLFNDDSEDVV